MLPYVEEIDDCGYPINMSINRLGKSIWSGVIGLSCFSATM